MSDQTTLNVKLLVDNDTARNALLEYDCISIWNPEDNQLDVTGATHAACTLGGGINIHRPDGEDDIRYPEKRNNRVKHVTPDIRIIDVLPE